MITVYYLPVENTPDGDQVAGVDSIHHALLAATEDGGVMMLLMDTTPDEHALLAGVAVSTRPPTQEEIVRFNAREIEPEPDQDVIRARAILATSPDAITQPEIWELLRILGRRLGY